MKNNAFTSSFFVHPAHPKCNLCSSLATWAGKAHGEAFYYCDACHRQIEDHAAHNRTDLVVCHPIKGIWECARCGDDRVQVANCTCLACGTHTAPPTKKDLEDYVDDLVCVTLMIDKRFKQMLYMRLSPLNKKETRLFQAYRSAEREALRSYQYYMGLHNALYPS